MISSYEAAGSCPIRRHPDRCADGETRERRSAERCGVRLAGSTARGSGRSPPFWKYNVIDIAGQLELEVGVATATPATADDRISVGELPAGRYLETTYHGHPDGLRQVTSDLLARADAQGLTFEKTDSPRGERWAARLEYYLTRRPAGHDPVEHHALVQAHGRSLTNRPLAAE